MINPLHLYPTLHEDDIQKLFSSLFSNENGEKRCGYSFFFPYNGNMADLAVKVDEFNSFYMLEDENSDWTPDKYPLHYKRELTIYNPSSLYGSGEKAIAAKNAKIGLALRWTSKGSKRRGAIKISNIPCQEESIVIPIIGSFPASDLYGEITLSLIIYISESGVIEEGEEIYANTVGDILGEIDSLTIILDGYGSSMPIYECSIKGGNLWSVNCNWQDPAIDPFSQTVSIYLNKSSELYKFIDRRNKKNYNKAMLHQIIASAMAAIIENLRSKDRDFKCLEEFEEGSVAQAIKYFCDKHQWDITNPTTTINTINYFFERKDFGL